MRDDPFAEYRTPQPSFDVVTGTDGRTLTLTAIDHAAFLPVAHTVVQISNRTGWRVAEIRHRLPGANIERLTVTPTRL